MSRGGSVTFERASGLAPDPRFPLSRGELHELMDVVLEAMGMEGAVFTVRLVDDAEIARLNREFLGCQGPTNVLSFPAQDAEDMAENGAEEGGESEEGESLGEMALSVDTLVREAELYGQDPAQHTARLLAHATLHLAGFDHGPEMDMLTGAAVDAVADAWS